MSWYSHIKTSDDKALQEQARLLCGMCFKWAMQWSIDHQLGDHKVVHGMVTGGLEMKTFGHAWIEDGDTIYDERHPDGMSRDLFYEALNPEDTVKYTPTEATRALFKHNQWGPWHM